MLKSIVQEKDLSIRVPLYHPDLPFIVMWSEKAACTTIKKWFFSHAGLLKRALNYHRWIHNFESEVFKSQDGYLEECVEALNSGKPVLKFVRNPYERLYSGYLETCRRHVLTDEDHWSTQTRQEILTFLIGENAEIQYAYSFEQFVAWLQTKSERSLDVHLLPQRQAYEKLVNLRVVKLDGTDSGFREIEQEFRLKDTSGKPNVYVSGHHHTKQTRSLKEQINVLSVGVPIQRDKNFLPYDISADAIARSSVGKKILNMYSQDFSAYGYHRRRYV